MAVLMVSEQKHSSGGNWGTVVAAVHNIQPSRQIGEQLLRAICLTSQRVKAGKRAPGLLYLLTLAEDSVSPAV